MRVYAELYKQQRGRYPARAVLVFLGELGNDSVWKAAAGCPSAIPGLFHEVPFKGELIDRAMEDFRMTVRDIEVERELPFAKQWEAPDSPPGESTCNACEIRFSCSSYADAKKQRAEPL